MRTARHPTIGPLHPRLALTLALVPLSLGGLLLSFPLAILATEGLLIPAEVVFPLALLTPLAVFYFGSLWIWWSTVRWTARKRVLVLLVTLGLTVVVTIGLHIVWAVDEDAGFMVLMGAITIGGGLALIIINRICWTPPDSAGAMLRVPCPICGHDMRDASSCQCPACNGIFSLVQLVESTRVADAIGITRDSVAQAPGKSAEMESTER